MRRFCFIHAADLHLDTPFEGIRGVDPDAARVLRDASLEAFDALVELCLERRAAFLLIAGDVYDGAERGLRAQLRFRAGLERLSRAGIAVFVVHGNHDPAEEGWSAIRAWPEGTTIFGPEQVDAVPVFASASVSASASASASVSGSGSSGGGSGGSGGEDAGGAPLATIYGISYGRRDVSENLSLRFPRRGAAPRAEQGLRIGLLHCNAGGHAGHAPYSACSVFDLAAADIDYWALGHVHVRQVLSQQPWIVYPGSLQGRSPHAGEQGAKGAVVVEVEDGRVARAEFEPLDRVRFLAIALDVSDCEDLAAVERALRARADALVEANRGRSLVLSAQLEGRSAIERDLARARSADELLSSLRDAARGAHPFVWWAAVTSAVSRPIDRDAWRERDDFCAQLLELSDELAARPDELRRFVDEVLADLPERLRDGVLPELEDGEALRLLQRAEQVALEIVGDDDGPASRPGVGA